MKFKEYLISMLSERSGKPSFLRSVGLPIIATGIFMLVYGTIKEYDTAVFTGGTIIFMGLSGKLAQKSLENKEPKNTEEL